MKKKKTDNRNLANKLTLRRYFLDKYFGNKELSVLDCCQGSQIIWSTLRREYKCHYMGVDVKPKQGRLKIDSKRLLQINADKFDVIDIDTYGSPLQHISALMPLIKKQVILFLTYGQVRMGGGNYDHSVKRILGFDFDIPNSIGVSLQVKLFDNLISGIISRLATIDECVESPRSKHARYIGLVVTPKIKIKNN